MNAPHLVRADNSKDRVRDRYQKELEMAKRIQDQPPPRVSSDSSNIPLVDTVNRDRSGVERSKGDNLSGGNIQEYTENKGAVDQEKEIWPLVIKDIEERRSIGINRYGTTLKSNNGRDGLVDLYQELLDSVVYIRQVIEEDWRARALSTEAHLALAQRDLTLAKEQLSIADKTIKRLQDTINQAALIAAKP